MTDNRTKREVYTMTENTTYLEAMTDYTTSVKGMNEWRWRERGAIPLFGGRRPRPRQID
jgi:hypothetical protein